MTLTGEFPATARPDSITDTLPLFSLLFLQWTVGPNSTDGAPWPSLPDPTSFYLNLPFEVRSEEDVYLVPSDPFPKHLMTRECLQTTTLILNDPTLILVPGKRQLTVRLTGLQDTAGSPFLPSHPVALYHVPRYLQGSGRTCRYTREGSDSSPPRGCRVTLRFVSSSGRRPWDLEEGQGDRYDVHATSLLLSKEGLVDLWVVETLQ